MTLEEANNLINEYSPVGFYVHFMWIRGSDDYFLDHYPADDEPRFNTEQEAWNHASIFAQAMIGKVVDVYVVDQFYNPVINYESQKLLGSKI